jgi:hypothetical protein
MRKENQHEWLVQTTNTAHHNYAPKKCWSAGRLLGVLSKRSGRDAGDLGTLVLTELVLVLPLLPFGDLLDADAGWDSHSEPAFTAAAALGCAFDCDSADSVGRA